MAMIRKADIGTNIFLSLLYLFLAVTTGQTVFWLLLLINAFLFGVSITVSVFKTVQDSEGMDYDNIMLKEFYKIIWCYYNINNDYYGNTNFYNELYLIRYFLLDLCAKKKWNIYWLRNDYSFNYTVNELMKMAYTDKNDFYASTSITFSFLEFKESMKRYFRAIEINDNIPYYYNDLQSNFSNFYNTIVYTPLSKEAKY